jgi:hypothetical protein
MASNYPPGVTGREYEIAGPDTEREADGTCSHCGLTGPGLIQTYGYSEWFICDACEETTDLPDLPEPDYLAHAGEEPGPD